MTVTLDHPRMLPEMGYSEVWLGFAAPVASLSRPSHLHVLIEARYLHLLLLMHSICEETDQMI